MWISTGNPFVRMDFPPRPQGTDKFSGCPLSPGDDMSDEEEEIAAELDDELLEEDDEE